MTEESLVADTSFAQQSLWLQNEITPGQSAYNVTAAVRLRGPLDVPVLRRALGLVVDRHEVLRTTFDLDDGDPVQVIHPSAPVDITVLDTTEEEFEETARRELETPFDLRQGPLIRFRLLRLAPDHHVALLAIHHIVTDGLSSGILFGELTAAYADLRAGREPRLPELPIQYADFAAWQRERLTGEHLDGLRAHWARELSGARPPELPTDRPRPAVASGRGAAHHFTLPRALVQRVEALARRRTATPFMVLLAAFNVLLARYGGQDDITVVSPTAGRTRPELEGLIGYFVNPLFLRTDLSGDPDFLDLLDRVRTAFQGAVAHEELPFEQAADLLRQHAAPGAGEDPARVLMVLQAKAPERWTAAGLTFEMAHVGTGTAKMDLAMDVRPADDGHRVVLEYSTDVFDDATVVRLAGHYVALLEAIAEQPDRPLSRLPLLDAEERRTVLAAAPGARTGPATGPVHAAVEEWAARTPDAPALTTPETGLTYRQLDRRAGELAQRLRTHGVRPGTPVALRAMPSADLAVTAYAVLKAGGACFPLHPDLPEHLERTLLTESGALVLPDVSAPSGRPPAPAGSAPLSASAETVPPSGSGDSVPLSASAETVPPSGSGDSVPPSASAETVPPSGSVEVVPSPDGTPALLAWTVTGEGAVGVVPLSHTAVLTAARGAAAALDLAPGGVHRCAPDSPEQFLRELPAALARGATLELAPPEQAGAPEADRPAPRLRFLPGTAGAYAVATPAAGQDPVVLRPAGYDLHVLDEHLEPVPFGAVGDLHLGGPAVGTAPDGAPGTTAAARLPGGRLFRTGERARLRPDGTVLPLGRTDGTYGHQALPVDPAAVESVLAGLPGVADCAVVVRPVLPGGPGLVAYVVPPPGEHTDADALLKLLGDRVPGPWLPAAVVGTTSLPRTASGALAVDELPPPPAPDGPAADGDGAPRTPFEEEVARIWAEVLEVDAVGIHDNFFDLGGQSLTAVRLAARLRDTFAVELALSDLYADFTVAEVAWTILRRLTGDDPADH
ncbi:condensation domain-containing protein [Streptomyces sp. WI03-4A]|uniref:condensation domain-containing protein n=1 Tax=Streptomyces sp. WI03-4A TaxID=3028706 RepID=UPI0029B12E16|nr:condensation domain-containing protein [Streptomyces sp. WI03-4A]MDX2593976.1 condensation domain-containing protein [Streptomyces sp. WI03-4A]